MGVIIIKKGYYFIFAILAAMLLISQTHLKESFGDQIFEAIGISPWSKSNQNGMHLPVILAILLLCIGVAGAQRTLKDRHPRITRYIVIGCIAFFVVFPWATEGYMFVVKYNVSDAASAQVSNGKCNFVSNENNVNADCSFKIYNYGKSDEVVIRPILPTNMNRNADIVFEANTLTLERHSKQNVTMRFEGTQNNGSGFNGWGQDIDLEVISTNKR